MKRNNDTPKELQGVPGALQAMIKAVETKPIVLTQMTDAQIEKYNKIRYKVTVTTMILSPNDVVFENTVTGYGAAAMLAASKVTNDLDSLLSKLNHIKNELVFANKSSVKIDGFVKNENGSFYMKAEITKV